MSSFGDIDNKFFMWVHNSIIFGSNEIFQTSDPPPKKKTDKNNRGL